MLHLSEGFAILLSAYNSAKQATKKTFRSHLGLIWIL